MRRRRNQVDPQALLSLFKGKHLIEPPRSVLLGAVAIGEALGRRRRSAVAWLVERIFDSGLEPVLEGVRSSGTAERRILYQLRHHSGAEAPRQIDLRLRREPAGTLEITGQLLPTFPDARVDLRSARTRRGMKLADLGEFLVRGLPIKTGRIQITIEAPGLLPLVVADVPLPEPERTRS